MHCHIKWVGPQQRLVDDSGITVFPGGRVIPGTGEGQIAILGNAGWADTGNQGLRLPEALLPHQHSCHADFRGNVVRLDQKDLI